MSEFEPEVEESVDEIVEDASEGEELLEEAAPEEPQRYRVKVDGEEQELTLEELQRGYAHGSAANKRMQEAARLRKEAEQEKAKIAALKNADPAELLAAFGMNAKEFAEALLLRDLEEQLLSPDEKELRRLRNIEQEYSRRQQAEQRQREEAAKQAALESAGSEIDDEITSALEASGIKPTPRTVARVAEMLLASLDDEGNRLSAHDALGRLKGEYRQERAEYLESLDPAELEREHPALVQKILDYAAGKVTAPVPKPPARAVKRQESARPKAKSIDEILAEL